ncbi:hyaluronan-mediated motility receptor-like [Engraulis encrasicolus]|uniref:hyaluronan-mediated motility receptor-like n=1 Tax=Engraulis encrasicolus TaxID=184585 RepID=UPI002FD5B331
MRTAISLLMLLYSMCAVQTESQGTEAVAAEVSTQTDRSAEMKELRDMLVELRATLKHTQEFLGADRMAVQERLTDTDRKVAILHSVLGASKAEMKTEVDDLKRENAAQQAELTLLKTRLAASEAKAINLKVENAEHGAELTAMKSKLAATETEVKNMEKEIKSTPKVAFSAGLTDSKFIVAGSNALNLVLSRIITNVGEAYNNTTGFFTAPVRGVYYLRFTVLDVLDTQEMGIRMLKNGQQLIWLSEYDTDGIGTYLSSGLTLQLEEGDVVNLGILANYRLWDSSSNHCTFSGFLLFSL